MQEIRAYIAKRRTLTLIFPFFSIFYKFSLDFKLVLSASVEEVLVVLKPFKGSLKLCFVVIDLNMYE